MNPQIIIGIDPGTNIMGYSVIRISSGKPELLTVGVLYLNKIKDHYIKLHTIFDKVTALIKEYHPNELAIEAPFFGKNVQSMLKLGRAQGTAIAAALNLSLPIHEYSPRKIKQSITGNGNASKEQVAAMLSNLLVLRETPETLDASDAIAVALCHFYQNRTAVKTTSYTGWKAFIQNNQSRLG
jgi:crossover junction endodeoxyribonuclease RuvC